MSMLDTIKKPDNRAPIITIMSDAGMGKTTLAATFPNPIFIRAEDGIESIPYENRPQAFPVIEKEEDLWGQLKALIVEDHDFKTLVIDSVTKLETLFIQSVIENDPKKPKGLNQALGGYGNGPAAVTSLHLRVRKACDILNTKKGMTIIFIGHADLEELNLPDQETYMRYCLRMSKKSVSPYVDDVDLVGFIKLETFLIGDEEARSKKAVSSGDRVLVAHAVPANISKNRHHIKEEIPLPEGKNPLMELIPYFNNTQKGE